MNEQLTEEEWLEYREVCIELGQENACLNSYSEYIDNFLKLMGEA